MIGNYLANLTKLKKNVYSHKVKTIFNYVVAQIYLYLILFPFVSDNSEFETMKNKNQTSLKNIKPFKIN